MRAPGRRCGQTTERYPVWSGALVTAGDVAFYGTLDGWFKAADAKTGKVLWQFKSDREWWATRLPTRDPIASSTWRCTPGSAATGSCWRGTSGLMTGGCAAAGGLHVGHRPAHQPGGIVWIFAL